MKSKLYHQSSLSFRFCLLLLVFYFLLTCNFALAQRIGLKKENWQQINTPHFEIFHSAQHQDLGRYYARIAEQSYLEITSLFPSAPQEKIVVIINDSTDAANGFTTLIPYPYIMIYPVQVAKGEVLSESAEWAKELFVHELAHVFQLYPANGIYRYIKPFLGTIVAPNLLMPIWWKEGMAVEVESLLSHQGRTKSDYQDASIRALVLENKLLQESLPKINESLPSWPYGGRAYLYGSMLMSDLNLKNNRKSIGLLTEKQGFRLPFALEDPQLEVSGENYEASYLKTLNSYQSRALDQIKKIELLPTSIENDLKLGFVSSRNPRLNFEQKILAVIGFDQKGKRLALFKKEPSQQWAQIKLKNSPQGDISSFEFHPFSNKIVYAKIKPVDQRNNFSDLYIYDIEQDKETRLTQSGRGRQPLWFISNSGEEKIFYISSFNGKTQLQSVKTVNQSIEQYFETHLQERIHEVSKFDDKSLIVVIKNRFGEHQVYKYFINEDKMSSLEINFKKAENFKFIKGFLYFTSAENGVANLYRYDLINQKAVALSNFKTAAMDFELDLTNSQAFTSVFTSQGTQVKSVKLVDFENLPKITNEVKNRYNYQESQFQQVTHQEVSSYPQEQASSFKYLWPKYVIPFITTASQSRGAFVQLITSGQDPLLIHRYNLSLDYDSFLEKLGYNLDYINSALRFPIILSARKRFISVGTTQNQFIDRERLSVGFIVDTFDLSPQMNLQIGFSQSKSSDQQIKTNHQGPYAQVLYTGFRTGIFDIYPRNGWAGFLRFENNKAQNNNLSDFFGDYDQALASVIGFTSFLLPENHSLYAKANALHTFQSVSARLFGTSNSFFASSPTQIFPEFLARGYTLGQFFGSRMVSITTEYRFPVFELQSGSGTDPYFLKRINAALTADGLILRGGSFSKNNDFKSENMNKIYSSVGLEARLETTLGYLLPVNFVLGTYNPFDPQYANSPQVSLSLQIGADFTNFNH